MTLKPARLQWSEDGRLISLDYDDVYFQSGHAIAESDYVFLQHNNLASRFAAGDIPHFSLCELGFGTGLNFLLTAKLFLETAPADHTLTYVSIEKHPIPTDVLAKLHGFWPELQHISQELLAGYPPLITGFHTVFLAGGRIRLILALGDAGDILPQLSGAFDAWYLDGFTPGKNPDMWADDFFPLIAARTAPAGTLTSFSVLGRMRRAFAELGFTVEKVKGYGIKWSMTRAVKDGTPQTPPQKHVVVIGAGIAGCSAARALALYGQRVTLIDKHTTPASETSGNPAAVIYPKMTVDITPMGQLYQHGFCYTRQMICLAGVESFVPCGVLHLNKTAEDTARHQEIVSRQSPPEDYVTHKAESGLFQPLAGFLSPTEFCQKLLAHPHITYRQAVAESIQQDTKTKHWIVTLESGDTLTADAVVIATGVNAAAYAQTGWMPLQSLRGQVTVLRATTASADLNHVICHDGYITPAQNGLHCIGATFQKEAVAETAPRDADDAENIAKLQKFLPHLKLDTSHIADHRAGFRMTTPDKLPLIGAAPDYSCFVAQNGHLRTSGAAADTTENTALDGFYIAAGFGAHGMTTAPLAGSIIAADICGLPLPVPQSLATALLPERFILRDLKRGKI